MKCSGWCNHYPTAKLIRVNGFGLNKCIDRIIFCCWYLNFLPVLVGYGLNGWE